MNEDEENIIPEDENNDEQNNINPEKGFEDIRISGGKHFYENNQRRDSLP